MRANWGRSCADIAANSFGSWTCCCRPVASVVAVLCLSTASRSISRSSRFLYCPSMSRRGRCSHWSGQCCCANWWWGGRCRRLANAQCFRLCSSGSCRIWPDRWICCSPAGSASPIWRHEWRVFFFPLFVHSQIRWQYFYSYTDDFIYWKKKF